jgi:thiamine biosynthesis protein ThiS
LPWEPLNRRPFRFVRHVGSPPLPIVNGRLMKINLNGDVREMPDAITIAALLTELHLVPEYLAVEVNTRLVPREQHGEHVLCEGDHVEVVTLVGGG